MLSMTRKIKRVFQAGAGMLVTLGLAALALTTALTAAAAEQVIVTNPVTVANPVTTVAVSAGQTAVANGPAAPVHTTNNDAFSAVSYSLGCSISAGVTNTSCTGNFLPPPGKRLVIEDVSFGGTLPSGQQAHVQINTLFHNATVATGLTPDALDNGSQSLVSGGRMTKIYADPGGVVQAFLSRTSGVNTGIVNIYLWGWLVDVQ